MLVKPPYRQRKGRQMAPPMQFVCKECSMQFSGPMPYMDHLKSAKHQKKVAAQKHLEMLTGGRTTVSSSLGSETAVGYLVTASLSLQIDPLPFVCKLCSVAMNCQDSLTAHNKEVVNASTCVVSMTAQKRP